jgi:septum formation protein
MARPPTGAAAVIQADDPALVLASGSAARRALLTAAGLRFTVQAAAVDESAVKHVMQADGATPDSVAMALAAAKARSVTVPGALVIGADQILVCNGEWYDKPGDVDGVMEHLLRLRGQTHTLLTAVTCWRDGAAVWQHNASCDLTMRDFSMEFLEAYLAQEGDACGQCVGGYRLEGLGLHLFARVEGEHAAILGLPMLPLLSFFRQCGVLLA